MANGQLLFCPLQGMGVGGGCALSHVEREAEDNLGVNEALSCKTLGAVMLHIIALLL